MTDLAFDHAPVGLIVLEQRIIRRCNLQFARIFGDSVAALTDLPVFDLYPTPDDFDRIGETLEQIDPKQDCYSDERIMRRRGGELFWCRVRGQSLTPEQPFHSGVWSFADLSDDRPVVSLTPRERDVAILTCRGLSAKEIGQQLGLSYRTVETHRAHLLRKFGARKLPELVAKLSGMPF